MRGRRCFIIDPVCAMNYGHSLNSLHYFAGFASKHFEKVEIFASRHLPISAEEDGIHRFFNFYYNNLIKIDNIISEDHQFDENLFESQEDAASYDFFRFFVEADINSDDTLLFPSADYYALIGLSNALRRLELPKRPRLLVRLINVMENVNSLGSNTLPVPVQRILALKKEGFSISLSAETPKYSRYLTDLSGVAFSTTPYPSFKTDMLALSEGTPFTVLCGGSGRRDKGFFRLIEIIEATNIFNSEIRFIIQNLHASEQFANTEFLNKLYAIPNVKLLPGVLPYSEIVQSYADSHICLMPYDAATYEYRGSAMLMESLLFGRQCVGQAGTGFAEQIKLYACGTSCGSNSEMAAAIATLSRVNRKDLMDRAAQSRAMYIADTDLKYTAWMDD